MDDKNKVVCVVGKVIMRTVLSKKSLIDFLTWTSSCLSSTEWLGYEILEKLTENLFAIELVIDKSLAVFYKSDYDALMIILGFVMPDVDVVCKHCKTKQEKPLDFKDTCPKCGLEGLESVPIQKRNRII